MSRKNFGRAAVSLFALLSAATAGVMAQQADPAIKVGAADLGGRET